MELGRILNPNMDSESENFELIVVPNKNLEDQPEIQKRSLNIRSTKLSKSCANIFNALSILKSLGTQNRLNGIQQTLLIKFEIFERFEELKSYELKELSHIFCVKSVVLFLKSSNDKSLQIYWKSQEIDYFLHVAPPKKKTSECKDTYGFIADFIIDSLNNGCLGVSMNCKHNQENNKIELNQLSNSEDLNLLQLAAEFGRTECMKMILDLGIFSDTPYEQYNAPSLALSAKHYNILLMLIENNFTYPPYMNFNELPEEVQKHIKLCEELHDAVLIKNIEKIEKILKENPNIRHFYNRNNKSVIRTALEIKIFDIYEILLANDIIFGPHEHFVKIFSFLSENDKTILREIHFKYSKDLPENHLNILMMNTQISHDDINREGKEELVMNAYKSLDKNPNLSPVLKVVAASKRFEIIFDFKRNSVGGVDPTTRFDTRGIFYSNHRICVGAKYLLDPEMEHETLGTLAHELCHYAMYLTFENIAKPYREGDHKAKEEFKRIHQFCMKNSEKNEIIDFAYKEDKILQHAELIVRPAHLIALYHNQPEELTKVQDIFPCLFRYYFDKIIPAMINAIPKVKEKSNKEIREKDKKIFKLTRNFYIAIGMGILITILVGMHFYKPNYVFNQLSKEKKMIVRNGLVNYKSLEIKFCELFPDNSTAYDMLTSDHISKMLNGEILNFDDKIFYYLDSLVSLKWENLPEKIRQKFLKSELNFQGKILKWETLHESYPEAFTALTSDQITKTLDGAKNKIGEKVKVGSEFYINRKFIPEDAKMLAFEHLYGYEYVRTEDNYKNSEHVRERNRKKTLERISDEFLMKNFTERSAFLDKIKANPHFKTIISDLNSENKLFMQKNSDEIIKMTEYDKIFVLSSQAGAGKTATFEHLTGKIKEKFSTRWVSYIDLKKSTNFYENGVQNEKILNEILNLNSEKDEFEVKVFEESFKSNNTVFIWNGFDEISPNYNENVLNLIKFIRNKTENIQYVCTRPLYSEQLSKTFELRTWQLVPFKESEKVEFLRKFFASKNIKAEKIDEYIKKSQKVIEKLQYENIIYRDFNTPLMLKLVAEIYINETLLESRNTFEIYNTFIEKKFEIWSKSGELATKTMQNVFLKNFDIIEIYEKYAFLSEMMTFSGTTLSQKYQKLQIMKKEIPKDLKLEEITRMGILYINSKKQFEFGHRTFAEFYVAKYFIDNIYNADDDYVAEDEAELRLELFFFLVKSYGEKNQIIVDFIWDYLKNENNNEIRSFAKPFRDLLRLKFKKFFFRILDTNHPKVFEFLFEFFKKDHELLLELLHVYETETLYTGIFNPSYFALAVNPEEIKKLSQNYLNSSEFENFINGRNQKGIFYYGLYFYEKIDSAKSHPDYEDYVKVFMYDEYFIFLQNIQNELTESEQKELFLAAMNPKIYIHYTRVPGWFHGFPLFELYFEDFWGRYEDLLTKDEQKNALGNALVQYNEINPQNRKGNEILITTLINYIENLNLTDLEIFEMFKNKNILHESHYYQFGFELMWNYLSNKTTMEQRREILLIDDKDDKNFYFFLIMDDLKNKYTDNLYFYFYYDFTPFKIFHKSLIVPEAATFNFTLEIYDEHFSKIEIQEIISSSNDFPCYFIQRAKEEMCLQFVKYLEELFEGQEKQLIEYLERKIKPTNFSIFEFVENLKDLPHADSAWFKNLEIFKNLYETVKNKEYTKTTTVVVPQE